MPDTEALIERLKLNSATTVPMPMAIPATRKAALPFRRFKLANAMLLIRMTILRNTGAELPDRSFRRPGHPRPAVAGHLCHGVDPRERIKVILWFFAPADCIMIFSSRPIVIG